jgi:hypothetical protein
MARTSTRMTIEPTLQSTRRGSNGYLAISGGTVKRMSRRKGHVAKRANGEKYYFFQYSIDLPGQEERKRQTEVVGSTSQMTKSEAARKKLEFVSKLLLHSSDSDLPSSRSFARCRVVVLPRSVCATNASRVNFFGRGRAYHSPPGEEASSLWQLRAFLGASLDIERKIDKVR